MFLCLYVCDMGVCISLCLCVYLSVCICVYLSVCMSVFVRVCESICAGVDAVQIICSNDCHQERRAQGRRDDTSNICFVLQTFTVSKQVFFC